MSSHFGAKMFRTRELILQPFDYENSSFLILAIELAPKKVTLNLTT